jgi:hypothetical protein
VNNATVVSTDDVSRDAGDENVIYGVECEGSTADGSPAVQLVTP